MPNIRPATFRLYRAALVHRFETEPTPESLKARDYLLDGVNDDGELEKRAGGNVTKKRTGAQKAKSISEEDLDLVIKTLINSRSKWGVPTAAWLKVGVLTGLRPVEWLNATVIEENGAKALKVRNAKNTHGRSHGEFRTIYLKGLKDKDILLIEKHIKLVKHYESEGKYSDCYMLCQRLLNKVSRKLFPRRVKHFTLYTGRHQFAADAKSTLSRVEVAAMMGHASIDTAKRHYGRAWKGSGRMTVRPAQENIDAVTKLNEAKLENTISISE